MRAGPPLLFAFLLLAAPTLAADEDAEAGASVRSRSVIVKFRGMEAGPGGTGLEACAERTFRQGRPFRDVTRDGSDSLDRLHERLRPRSIRAVFRRDDGRPFAAQRRGLQRRISARLSAGASARLPDLSHVYRVVLPRDVPVEEALAGYRADPHVAWAQRDHEQRVDALPNDPYLVSSGSWGQDFEDLWALHRIRAPEAWEISRGEGVVVAVVDTGIDYLHPDIADNIWINPGEDTDGNGRVDPWDWNGVDDDGNGFVDDIRGFDFSGSVDADDDGDFLDERDLGDPDPMDDHGHGTHVAGTVAAVADNGIGIVGVAPDARVMALKGLSASGSGSTSNLWRAVLYAAENGAAVINNSWSCHPPCPENPIAEEVVALVHAMDVVIVTSAGNRVSDVVWNSPEKLRETITVASTGQDDGPSKSFTNFGLALDLAAPGGGPENDPSIRIARRNILSLRASADETAEALVLEGIYLRNAGTSMASPHVAGTVALLRSAYPDLRYEQIRRILRESPTDLGPPGHDRDTGGGRLDALAALTYELPDLVAAFDAPPTGGVFSPAAGDVVEILGSVDGDDLEAWSLDFGHGNDPELWEPLVDSATDPVSAGLLARWPLARLPVGAYVVRLRATARDGRVFEEFLQLSLEDLAFAELSDRGRHARAPDVSGDRVVFQVEPDDPDDDEEPSGLDLFLADARRGTRQVLAGGPHDQMSASLAGGLVSFVDRETTEDGPIDRLLGCRLSPKHRVAGSSRRPKDPTRPLCADPIVLAENADRPERPATAAGHFYWLDRSGGDLDLRGCTPSPSGRCEPVDTTLDPRRRVFLRTDGASLSWSEAANRFAFCEVDPVTGACEAFSFPNPLLTLSRPTVSDGLVAWVEFAFGPDTPLVVCAFDPATGECPPIRVADRVSDPAPELSGERLVWAARPEGENLDVFFCELDSLRGRCPAQRLTAHMASDATPVIDGDRVAWVSDRYGADGILTTRLPSLRPIPDRRVRAGRLLVVPLGGSAGDSDGPLELEAEIVGADDLTAAGAWLGDGGRGRGLFVWRPDASWVGEQIVTFTGQTREGRASRRSIRIEVLQPAGSGSRTGRRAR